jgi:hypothetical protein
LANDASPVVSSRAITPRSAVTFWVPDHTRARKPPASGWARTSATAAEAPIEPCIWNGV